MDHSDNNKARIRQAVSVLLLALLLATAAASSWETWWRHQGHTPLLQDDKDLWAQHRARVEHLNPARSLVVLGASRIQLAFSVPWLEAQDPPWQAVSLAINGHYPIAVLEDLAENSDYAGTVLVAVDGRGLSHWYQDMSAAWVRHYQRDFGPQRRLERRLHSALQSRLVLSGTDFNLVRRLRGWLDKQPPAHPYGRLQADRTMAADYEQADVTGLRAHFVAALAADYAERPAPSIQRWLEDLEPVRRAVERIHRRGGQVVFLRMPTADGHLELDEANYPRAQYWDRLAERVGAHTLYFADDPELAALELPDTSHIDQRDRARFMQILMRLLEEQGVLRASQP